MLSIDRRQRHEGKTWWCRAALASVLWSVAAFVGAQTQSVGPAASQPAAGSDPVPVTGEVRFALGDGPLRLPTGVVKGRVDLTVSAEAVGNEPLPAGHLQVSDLTGPGSAGEPQVDFKVQAEHQGSGKGRMWFVSATVTGMALNSTLTRTALVSLGPFRRSVPYVLSNQPRSAPEFSITPPAPWLLSSGREACALLVAAGDQPIQGLRIAHASLNEKSQQAGIPLQALELCRHAEGKCVAPEPIAALSSQTLFLRIKEGQRPLGRFSGTVALGVDGRADTKPVALEVASTSTEARGVGALLIAMGVGGAFYLSVWSRARLQRLSALRPATAAREQIMRLLLALDAACSTMRVDLQALRVHFEELAAGLSETELDARNLLPGSVPGSGGSTDTAGLQAHLKTLEPQIAGLAVIVRAGVQPLLKSWEDAPAGEARDAVVKALLTLDAPAEAMTEEAAQALVAKARALARPTQVLGLREVRGIAPRAPLTLQHISAQIETINKATWLAYLVLTSVAGIALLIINNTGFGTLMDFVYCLFWGFGLPVTMEKLQQLSPSGVASPLGITLPK